jgi:hypothetical protein
LTWMWGRTWMSALVYLKNWWDEKNNVGADLPVLSVIEGRVSPCLAVAEMATGH